MLVTSSRFSFRRVLYPYIPFYVLGGLMLIIFQLCMNRIDWKSKQAIDALFQPVSQSAWQYALWIFILGILAFITRLASRFFIFNSGRDIEYKVRGYLLAHLHKLGTSFYATMPVGEIMSRLTSDLTQVRMFLGFGMLSLMNVVLALPSALQVMFSISVKLTLVCLVTVPISVLVTRLFSGKMFRYNKRNQEALGKLSSFVQQNLAGARVIRSFALEESQKKQFEEYNQEYLQASLQLSRFRGAMMPIFGTISTIGVLLFFLYGSSLLLKGEGQGGLSSGSFFAFSLALGRMTWPLISMGFVFAIIQRGRASYVRLQEIFETNPDIEDGTLPAPSEVKGLIEVKNLSFSYRGKAVLHNVNFRLPAGTSLAIMGKTGSGKSMVAMLLSRLLPTPKASVFLDDTDICDLPLSFLRKSMGYAQQEAFLFSTTIAQNISFALERKDEDHHAFERIVKAAQEASILEEIESLPDQFDTVVGERGVQLSGGQKQRISLARAFLWNPPILILDDPLSAVDAKTEAAILQAIETKAKRSTFILITHRVSAAKKCDQIIVLDQGVVVEQGTHTDLLQQQGVYARFAEEQKLTHELEEIGP